MDENKIEEMRQVIQNASCKGIECEKCWLKNSPTCVCVKALYNEGYRKESDTAREILDELLKEKNLENVYFTDENGDIRNRKVIRIEKIKDLAEKYGVDLGE